MTARCSALTPSSLFYLFDVAVALARNSACLQRLWLFALLRAGKTGFALQHRRGRGGKGGIRKISATTALAAAAAATGLRREETESYFLSQFSRFTSRCSITKGGEWGTSERTRLPRALRPHASSCAARRHLTGKVLAATRRLRGGSGISARRANTPPRRGGVPPNYSLAFFLHFVWVSLAGTLRKKRRSLCRRKEQMLAHLSLLQKDRYFFHLPSLYRSFYFLLLILFFFSPVPCDVGRNRSRRNSRPRARDMRPHGDVDGL